jgi:hypothetical protein
VLLSACLGVPVVRGGLQIGELADVGAAPAGPAPLVTGIVVRTHGRPLAWAAWSDVERMEPHGVSLASDAELRPMPVAILLARDVLDAQLVDVAGRRVVRVGDLDLDVTRRRATVERVEVGLDSVLRRLGLRRLARHAPRRTIAWRDVHLPVHPGAALTIDSAAPALARLSIDERARLAARLPPRATRIPRHLVPHRFPTHVLRRRRATR